MADWGYAQCNGPPTWYRKFPVAAGAQQSPIDICTMSCTPDKSLRQILIDYKDVRIGNLSNTGHSWKGQVTGGTSHLGGGPLKSEFKLEQFHGHWGLTDSLGSEHTINGRTYSGELHLVHYDCMNFKSFGEAAAKPGGLTVLGVLLKVGKEHQEMNKIAKLLPFIEHRGQSIDIVGGINPEKFIPADRSYWCYSGSLTTPPCYESVNWIVFREPVEVSQKQLDIFRKMKSYHPLEERPEDELKGFIYNNFRPPCPLNERQVKEYRGI